MRERPHKRVNVANVCTGLCFWLSECSNTFVLTLVFITSAIISFHQRNKWNSFFLISPHGTRRNQITHQIDTIVWLVLASFHPKFRHTFLLLSKEIKITENCVNLIWLNWVTLWNFLRHFFLSYNFCFVLLFLHW